MLLWIVLVLAWLLFKWSTESFKYFVKLDVPFEKPLPLVGNMLRMLLQKESIVELMQRNYSKYKSSK